MSDAKPLFSHHIFLFPFQWDYLPPSKNMAEANFSERTELDRVVRIMRSMPQWETSPFQIGLDHNDGFHTFNEYNYFFGYARGALALDLNEQETAHRYRYHIEKGQPVYYEITTSKYESDDPDQPEYRLRVRDILLTWYATGIGFLAFFLENYQTDSPADILRINDFGRRIYPQFLGCPGKAEDAKGYNYIGAPQGSFLAERIRLTGLPGKPIEEDFTYYNDLNSLNGQPIRLPDHISELLGKKFVAASRESVQRRAFEYVVLTPVIDDRMFVLSYYLHKASMDKVRKYDPEGGPYGYVHDLFWYAYLFVDPSENITCKSIPMQEALARKHTYDRWIGHKNDKGEPEGQLFGISRYSFMMLADPGWFTENIILNHYRYLYFQMMALALMQRATIIRFAAEAAAISRIIHSGNDTRRQKKLIREVYSAYLHFTNKVYFREITPQEQGIELYDKVREIMEIDADLLALQKEIEELHRYALLLESEKSGWETERLTWIATIFLPPTLIAAIFGFSNLPESYSFWPSLGIWLLSSIGLIILGIIILKLLGLTQK